MKPYIERILRENVKARLFPKDTLEENLVWHRDENNRIVEVVHSEGWLFQRDNEVPILLKDGDILKIEANEWHRIIKGSGGLVLKITEEKKKKLSKAQKKIAQAAPPPDEITGADFKALNKKSVDEANPAQYDAPKGSKRAKELEKAGDLYAAGDVKGAARIRRKMEKPHMAENSGMLERKNLREMINDIAEEAKLDEVLKELEQHLEEKKGKSPKGLSKAVKKSLDKKADKRCLTRGSVYAEFRAGLAAFLSSGSRKGMSAHQWAHARVNSANPSKKWAKVKKRKKCPKKKK